MSLNKSWRRSKNVIKKQKVRRTCKHAHPDGSWCEPWTLCQFGTFCHTPCSCMDGYLCVASCGGWDNIALWTACHTLSTDKVSLLYEYVHAPPCHEVWRSRVHRNHICKDGGPYETERASSEDSCLQIYFHSGCMSILWILCGFAYACWGGHACWRFCCKLDNHTSTGRNVSPYVPAYKSEVKWTFIWETKHLNTQLTKP